MAAVTKKCYFSNTRSPVYKKRSKNVSSLDFAFLFIFCTVVSYFQRSNVDSRFLLVPMFLVVSY